MPEFVHVPSQLDKFNLSKGFSIDEVKPPSMINYNPADTQLSPSLFEGFGKIESNTSTTQKSIFHWIYLLWKIDDERIINMANLDGFVYLMY